MKRDERCAWVHGFRRCRYEAGHIGPHSWAEDSEAARIIGAVRDHLAGEGVTVTEAEPRRDPTPASPQDTSRPPWESAGETVEGDLAIALHVYAYLRTTQEMVAGSASKLAAAWEPVPGTWMPRWEVDRFLLAINVLAEQYRRVAARAHAAAAAVRAGDAVAGRLIDLTKGGYE